MDKETQEGMKNLDFTVRAADLVKSASPRRDAEFSEESQQIEITDKREVKGT